MTSFIERRITEVSKMDGRIHAGGRIAAPDE
jgi:hypothetical protein